MPSNGGRVLARAGSAPSKAPEVASVGRRRCEAAERLPAEPGHKTQMFGVPSQDRTATPPLMHRRAGVTRADQGHWAEPCDETRQFAVLAIDCLAGGALQRDGLGTGH